MTISSQLHEISSLTFTWARRTIIQQYERIRRKGSRFLIAIAYNIVAIWIFTTVAASIWTPWASSEPADKKLRSLAAVQLIMLVVNIICALFYLAIYKYDLFRHYKVNQKNIWDDQERWKELRPRSIKLSLINLGIVAPITALAVGLVFEGPRFTSEVPAIWQIASQLYFCIWIESNLFFICHLIGHRYFYKYHKVHHEFNIPHIFGANHSDPVDYALGTVLPALAGVLLLGSRAHLLTLLYWALWRTTQGQSNHSNYDFDWSIYRIVPLSAGGSYHSFHHTHNIGNYGSFLVFQDTITETNLSYYKHIGVDIK